MDRRYYATNHYPLNKIFLRVLNGSASINAEMPLLDFCNQWYLKHYPILKKEITNQIAHQIYDHLCNNIRNK